MSPVKSSQVKLILGSRPNSQVKHFTALIQIFDLDLVDFEPALAKKAMPRQSCVGQDKTDCLTD